MDRALARIALPCISPINEEKPQSISRVRGTLSPSPPHGAGTQLPGCVNLYSASTRQTENKKQAGQLAPLKHEADTAAKDMGLKRLAKATKITSKHMLLLNRREPYKPVTSDRVMIENRRRLEDFEAKNAEGIVFVPDTALPPWQKSIATNLKQQATQMNFRGFRVRVADKQDEPGFPTHFR